MSSSIFFTFLSMLALLLSQFLNVSFVITVLSPDGVGVAVGFGVGIAVGFGVGFAVGFGVGFAVGFGVGFAVGFGVTPRLILINFSSSWRFGLG